MKSRCVAITLALVTVLSSTIAFGSGPRHPELPRLLYKLKDHTGAVMAVDYSPDGGSFATGSMDKTIKLWSAWDGKCVRTFLGHEAGIRSVAFSFDGERLVSASDDGTVRVWEVSSGKQLAVIPAGAVYAAFSPNGLRIVTAAGRSAQVWSAEGELIRTLSGHDGAVATAAFSPDGASIVTAGQDGTARVWSAQTGQAILIIRTAGASVRSAFFSPESSKILTANGAGPDDYPVAQIWDAENGNLIASLQGHKKALFAANYSPDGNQVITSSWDSSAIIWDVSSRPKVQLPLRLSGHKKEVRAAAISPDGSQAVTVGSDHVILVWQLRESSAFRWGALSPNCSPFFAETKCSPVHSLKVR